MSALHLHPLSRRGKFGAALALCAVLGVVLWRVATSAHEAHLDAVADMLIAREIGALMHADARRDCANYPGLCEQVDQLGPVSSRTDLKRLFAPLFSPHVSAADARQVAAAFTGRAGQQANRALREHAQNNPDYWQSLPPGERDAINALLRSPQAMPYTVARRRIGQKLHHAYDALLIANQKQLLRAPLAALASYTAQYATHTGETPPPPLVFDAIGNQYYAARARIVASATTRLTVASWAFRRAGGELPDQARLDETLTSASRTAGALAALQRLKPALERYLDERQAVYQERFAALEALERASTGRRGIVDMGQDDVRRAARIADVVEDRGWYVIVERVYATALAHPALMHWDAAGPAPADSALAQRFAQEREALATLNDGPSMGTSQQESDMRDTLVGRPLDAVLGKQRAYTIVPAYGPAN
jgi:hypothetical protein